MWENLDNLINQGYISKKKHPTENLYILNYTAKTQYEKLWNDLTLQCRGLIVDNNLNIKARCFNKFFNYEEVHAEVNSRLSSGLKFDLCEKMDGSLGILYWVGKVPFIATRGSFESEQAIRATQILYKNTEINKLDCNLTYLFEIIYPENRICVDYGKEEKLVFLAAFDIKSGEELTVDAPFKKPEFYNADESFENLKKLNFPNKEGYVVRFEDGYRFKIKFEEYVRIHSLIFSLSTRSIWNCLRNNQSLELEGIPDEIYSLVKSCKNDLIEKFNKAEKKSKILFESIKDLPRKEFAERISNNEHASVLFKMLDNKDYKDIIWKKIEPEYKALRYEEV